MTSLFHFKDNVHCRSLPRALSMPLLFPRLLYQIIEHIGFLTDPQVERRRGYEATLTIDRWRAMPRGFHLPPPGSDEDEPTDYSPRGDLSPIAEHVMALIRGAVSRHALRGGNQAGRAGLGRANTGPGLARFFWAKILTAQPALKSGRSGQIVISRQKKIRAGRAWSGQTGLGHTGPGQIWPGFFGPKI